MGSRAIKVDKAAALCGMIWFVFIIDACFTWFFPVIFRNAVGSFFVFYATVILFQNQGLRFSTTKVAIAISLILLMLWLIVSRIGFYKIAYTFFEFAPFLCVIFWRDSALLKFYHYFRKFVIFYAVISLFVEILVLTHVWIHLPHLVFPPQDQVQENAGTINYFYGLFCIPTEDTSLTFYRACGPLREGGHFVFFIGFVYFMDRVLYRKINIPLIICGLLTLSPNIVAILLLTEGYIAVIDKNVIKPVLGLVASIGLVVALYIFSPQSIKDEITHVVLERSLEASLEGVDSEGFISILDGRVEMEGKMTYDEFLKAGIREKMLGVKDLDPSFIMSDFRWLFLYCGYVGSILFLLCTILIAFQKERSFFSFCILVLALLVSLQRVWMFLQPYIWTMMLLCTTAKRRLKKKKIHYARVLKK